MDSNGFNSNGFRWIPEMWPLVRGLDSNGFRWIPEMWPLVRVLDSDWILMDSDGFRKWVTLKGGRSGAKRHGCAAGAPRISAALARTPLVGLKSGTLLIHY